MAVTFEVIDTHAGGRGDEHGVVEFVASYRHDGVEQRLSERSTFWAEP